jgi:uncharacterized membrane protein
LVSLFDTIKIILTVVKNKVKHLKVCFTIEYHLCHIDDQSILAAIVHYMVRTKFWRTFIQWQIPSAEPRLENPDSDEKEALFGP